MSHIEFKNVSKSYGLVEAVADVSMSIDGGQFVTLLGPSGSGKTTTMRMIAGLERADRGTISIGGRVMSDGQTFVPTHRRRLGMVFQSYAIWPHKTVWENVAFPLQQRGVSKADQNSAVRGMLENVGLGNLAERYPAQLSGGQQQRVSLARALVAEPEVILFDEPLSNLDAQLRDTMRDLLADLHNLSGKTFIYVTHDQTEAMVLSDQVYLMNRGRIVQRGSPAKLYESPANRFVAEFIGRANVLAISTYDGSAGTVILTDGATFQVAPPGKPPVENILVIRPHQLNFVGDGERSNVIEGVIKSASYLGDRTRYLIDTQVGSAISVEIVGREQQRTERGEHVRVHFPPAACSVI